MTARRNLLVACGEPSIRAVLDALEASRFGASIRAVLDALEASRFGAASVERILLPGGCWWLAEAASASGGRLKRLVASRIAAVEAVTELLSDLTVESVFLVGHQDCSWYRQRHPTFSPGDLAKRAGQDIYAARDELLRLAVRPLPVAGTMLLRQPSAGWSERSLFR